jgi:hypothetical protein
MSTVASITKNSSGNWKAIIRRKGWPPIIKTFRAKRGADDWARTTEDEIIRGIYIRRMVSERTTADGFVTKMGDHAILLGRNEIYSIAVATFRPRSFRTPCGSTCGSP